MLFRDTHQAQGWSAYFSASLLCYPLSTSIGQYRGLIEPLIATLCHEFGGRSARLGSGAGAVPPCLEEGPVLAQYLWHRPRTPSTHPVGTPPSSTLWLKQVVSTAALLRGCGCAMLRLETNLCVYCTAIPIKHKADRLTLQFCSHSTPSLQ